MIKIEVRLNTLKAEIALKKLFLEFDRRAYLKLIGARARVWMRDHAPKRPGRETRPRWKKLRTTFRYRVRRDEVSVGTRNPKAYWYEKGTKPHQISPTKGKVLAIPTQGGTIFRTSASHPGQPPRRILPSEGLAERMAREALQEYVERVIRESVR